MHLARDYTHSCRSAGGRLSLSVRAPNCLDAAIARCITLAMVYAVALLRLGIAFPSVQGSTDLLTGSGLASFRALKLGDILFLIPFIYEVRLPRLTPSASGSPFSLKAWMALRAVWGLQPKERAIW